MRVGILTLHHVPNVGALLQCRSLVKAVRSLGHVVEVINYVPQALPRDPSPLAAIGSACRSMRNPAQAVEVVRNYTGTTDH